MENFPANEAGRKFSSTQYLRKLSNGEKVNRDSKQNQYRILHFLYSNWRHFSVNISCHENSTEHMKNAKKWHELKLRLSKKFTVDKEQQKHDIEKKRWRAIIKRMICIV